MPPRATPTGANEPPRSDQPSEAPVQLAAPEGGTGVGVSIVSAPSGSAAADPNAVVKPVGPVNTALPAAEKPAEAPVQINDIKPGQSPATARHHGRQEESAQGGSERRVVKQEEKEEGAGQAQPVLG